MTEPTATVDNSAPTGAAKQTKPAAEPGLTSLERVHLPRISIKFCTQCRWMLRAAYVCSSFFIFVASLARSKVDLAVSFKNQAYLALPGQSLCFSYI